MHPFVQDNHSRSVHGTLRGLHYQIQQPQGKLVWVIRGEILDVVVDLRRPSPTFGRWRSTVLGEDNRLQLAWAGQQAAAAGCEQDRRQQ